MNNLRRFSVGLSFPGEYRFLQKVIEFCKSELKINRIIGICFTANQASSRMMMRQGFILEQTIVDYHEKPEISDKSGSIYALKFNTIQE